MHKAFAVLTAAFLLSGAGLRAQNLFALPGADSTADMVSVYVANPLISVKNFTAGVGSFQVVGKSDNSRYYIFSSTSTNSVASVDSSFENQKLVGNLSQKPRAILPLADGRRIVVAAGSLQVVDMATDTISPVPNVNAFDVAASLDGSKIYALNSSGTGSILYAIDPIQLTVLNSLNIDAAATGVAVGPNGLVYVSAQGELVEIDPTSLTPTPSGTIQVNGRPGKAAFTPDGEHAVAVNLTPNTGTAALLFDLPSHTLKSSIATFMVTLDSLVVASNSTLFAYSSQTNGVYQVTISSNASFTINPLVVSGVSDSAVNALALSNEVAGPGTSGANSLYIASSSGTVYRIDLAFNRVGGHIVPSSAPAALSFVAPAVTNAAVTTLLSYGGTQTVAPNGTSLPMVVRALDASGHPIKGASVAFTVDNPNAHLTASNVTSGMDGYAQVFMTAPTATGIVHVTAEAGSKSASYAVTVAAPVAAGPAAALTLVAGQGQILFANFTTNFDNNSPLTVKLTDANGNPVAGTKVTFTLAPGGIGTFTGGVSTGVGQQSTITTDKNGLAAINFAAGPLPQLSPFIQDTITAKAPGTNTITFYLTVTSQSPSPTALITNETPGAVISGQAGTVVKGKFTVHVSAPSGQPIPNVSIRLQNAIDPKSPPAATCVDPTGAGILTDSLGNANCDLMIGGTVGSNNSVAANVGYQLNTFSVRITITPGPPGLIAKVSGDNQTGKPGTQLPAKIIVQVSDGFGNILPNVPVSFVATAGLTLSHVSGATDANGSASATVTLGSSLGPQTVTVTAGSATAVFTETVVTAATNIQKTGGDLQRTIINTTFPNPLVVQVTDIQNNPVSGVPLTFAVAAGSATLSAASAITDATGSAAITVAAGVIPGPVIITASVTGTNISTTFNLSATRIVAAAIHIVSGNTQTALINKAFHDPLVVNVTDSNGNPVSGVPVAFAVVNSSAQLINGSLPAAAATAILGTPNVLTDANGNASTTVTAGPTAGTITITASTGAFSTTFTLTAILPGPVIKSVVNGASFKPGISPGSIATIIGTGFATDIQGVVTSGAIVGPLQTSLAGVGVNIGGIDAPLFSVSNVDGQEQVTFQVPFELVTGTTTLTLTAPDSSPTSKQVNIQHYSPGIFEYAKPGHFAVLIRPDGSYVSDDNPAHPGEQVIMFATGLGPTDPPVGTNQAGLPGQNLVGTVVLGVNAKGVNPISVTTYPGVVGVYEVTFTIPENAKTGPNVQLGLAVKPSPKSKGINAQNVFAPIEP